MKIAPAHITEYSRANPSPRYVELNALYQQMHKEGTEDLPPDHVFPGKSLPPQAASIKQMILKFGANSILDYGCGKGYQYEPMNVNNDQTGEKWDSIQAFWGVESITCYDPAYEPHMTLPEGQFDGVICTDVLEHCPEDDIHWIIGELFTYAKTFIFANIACYPAKKTLPNGENAHCTIQPPEWWMQIINHYAMQYPDIAFQFVVAFYEQRPEGVVPRQVMLNSTHMQAA